ncbi:hypothetical protein SAMN05421823_10683 [Catalinimonas alkaloidigena]|uniref:Uncharacterized protein n=2 Tax=Catalinimonas alkaloidigena TaxID=1075417 RepID=A0A1G9K7R1_9BACT|nr:hypothetical protein SAMN05421823_10683 [Catalinimonas alkaloidigena]
MLGIVPQHWQHLLRQAKCITLATEDYDGTEDASTDSTEKDVEEQPQKELNDRLLTQLFTFQCIPHSLLPICYGDSRPSTLLQAETPHATPPPERG